MQPTPLALLHAGNAENPLWHRESKSLFVTDIPNGRLYQIQPDGSFKRVYEGRHVGGFTVQADGKLLLLRDAGNVVTWWQGEEKTLIEFIPGEEKLRFNDGIADPLGRVYTGTYGEDRGPLGRLYRIEPDGSYEAVLDGLGCSNGMGFTPDGEGFYHVDSVTRTVFRMDYDRASGRLSGRRPFVVNGPERGVPDGMTVDANGQVWVAYWDGHAVSVYSDSGKEVERIEFPVAKVSCVTLEGDTAFATTAGGNGHSGPEGSVFSIALPSRLGVPEFRSRIGM